MKLIYCISLIFLSMPLMAGTIKFESDFESGAIQSDGRTDGWRKHTCEAHSLHVVKQGEMGAPAPRTGSYMSRFELRSSDRSPSGCTSTAETERAEIWTDQNYLSQNSDNWVGISMYMPSASWNPGKEMIIFQIHGCQGNGPSPCVVLEASSNTWSGYYRANQNLKALFDAPIAKDRWVDFVLQYRPSSGSDGLIKVWIDGNEVVNATGPNMSSEFNPYTKTGIYTKTTGTLVSFRDSIKIATCARGEDCRPLVAPGTETRTSATPATPTGLGLMIQ